MLANGDRRRTVFWRPASTAVTEMLRVEREDRVSAHYSEHFLVVVVYQGAFDGWYRGGLRTHVAGEVSLKEPGEVHRRVRVHAPFTIQGATFAPELVRAMAAERGLRGAAHFRAPTYGPRERPAQLAFAMHEALVRPDATELERGTRVAEALGELLGGVPGASDGLRAPRAVRRARAYLHDALDTKVTLDELAAHSGIDKFHLVRAFRAAVGVPPYEYLTQVRVWQAAQLLRRGSSVTEAALAVGFCDESQLHRHFRRIVGTSPGRFARSVGGGVRNSQHRPGEARGRAAQWRHE